MPNAKDRTKTEHIHVLLYGPSGSGKTHLLGEFLKAGSLWVNDTDQGIDTLAGMDLTYEQWYNRPGDTKVADKDTAWGKLTAFITEQIEEPEYDTYAFDSLTTHADAAAAYVIWKGGASRAIVQLQDYQSIYSELTQFIINIRKLKANVILTSHEEMVRDETGKMRIVPLVLGDKFAPRLPLFWNNVWHIDVEAATEGKEPTRRLIVQKDGKHMAKSLGNKKELSIGVTYEEIIKHLEGGK